MTDAKGLSEVPRYIEMPRFYGAVSFMRLHSEGPWIRYSDYTALAERLKSCEDKAVKYDLDQAGIEQRAAEAVELVELRAKLKACEEERDRAKNDLVIVSKERETFIRALIDKKTEAQMAWKERDQLTADLERARARIDELEAELRFESGKLRNLY